MSGYLKEHHTGSFHTDMKHIIQDPIDTIITDFVFLVITVCNGIIYIYFNPFAAVSIIQSNMERVKYPGA